MSPSQRNALPDETIQEKETMGAHWQVELVTKPARAEYRDDKFPCRFSRKGDAQTLVDEVASYGGEAKLVDLDKLHRQKRAADDVKELVKAAPHPPGTPAVRRAAKLPTSTSARYILRCGEGRGEKGYVVWDTVDREIVFQSDSKIDAIAQVQKLSGFTPVDGDENTLAAQREGGVPCTRAGCNVTKRTGDAATHRCGQCHELI